MHGLCQVLVLVINQIIASPEFCIFHLDGLEPIGSQVTLDKFSGKNAETASAFGQLQKRKRTDTFHSRLQFKALLLKNRIDNIPARTALLTQKKPLLLKVGNRYGAWNIVGWTANDLHSALIEQFFMVVRHAQWEH